MNTSYPNQKPGLYTTIAVLTLISGIVNLFWGFIASASALGSFFGVICLPITILPTILGAFEIVYAAKLLSNQAEPVQPSQTIAVFEILAIVYLNVFSMVVGILALIFYNDLSVKEYFARINGTAVITPTPTAPVILEPVPALVEEPELLSAPEESVISEPEEAPAKPKRIRKVAGE